MIFYAAAISHHVHQRRATIFGGGALVGAVNHDGILIATIQKNTWIVAVDERVYNLRGEVIQMGAVAGAMIRRLEHVCQVGAVAGAMIRVVSAMEVEVMINSACSTAVRWDDDDDDEMMMRKCPRLFKNERRAGEARESARRRAQRRWISEIYR